MVHVFNHLDEVDDVLPPLCDMTFEIVDRRYDDAKATWHLTFSARATPYKNVGFAASIPVSGWHEQVDGEGEDAFHSFWRSITLRSIGDESDRMLALLVDYYEITSPREKSGGWVTKFIRTRDELLSRGWIFASSINCLAVGIASNPALIADHVVRMKLFLDDGLENGHYAEVFFNIDMPEGFCALNEKDEEYRADLVHWLSRKGAINAIPVDRKD